MIAYSATLKFIDSSAKSTAYMHHRNESTLVQKTACSAQSHCLNQTWPPIYHIQINAVLILKPIYPGRDELITIKYTCILVSFLHE